MKAGLNCTEMCGCSSLENNCENSHHATHDDEDEVQDKLDNNDDTDELFV